LYFSYGGDGEGVRQNNGRRVNATLGEVDTDAWGVREGHFVARINPAVQAAVISPPVTWLGQSRTVAMWCFVRPTLVSSIIYNVFSTADAYSILSVRSVDNDNVFFGVHHGNFYGFSTPVAITLGSNWVHFAAVSYNENVLAYVNGEPVGGMQTSHSAFDLTYVGGGPPSADNKMCTAIDDLVVFDRVLSEPEVRATMTLPRCDNSPITVAPVFTCDELRATALVFFPPSNTTATNSSGRLKNITLQTQNSGASVLRNGNTVTGASSDLTESVLSPGVTVSTGAWTVAAWCLYAGVDQQLTTMFFGAGVHYMLLQSTTVGIWRNNMFLSAGATTNRTARWVHIAVTSSAGRTLIYIDGVISYGDATFMSLYLDAVGNIAGGEQGMCSAIDDLVVFDYRLNMSAVRSLMVLPRCTYAPSTTIITSTSTTTTRIATTSTTATATNASTTTVSAPTMLPRTHDNVTLLAVEMRVWTYQWKRPPAGIKTSLNTVFTFTAAGTGLAQFVFFYDCVLGRRAVIKDTGPGRTFERYTYNTTDGTGFVYPAQDANGTRCFVIVFIRDNGRGDSDPRLGVIEDDIGFLGNATADDVHNVTIGVFDESSAVVPRGIVVHESSGHWYVVPMVVAICVGMGFVVLWVFIVLRSHRRVDSYV
jgi:hypothetical protein